MSPQQRALYLGISAVLLLIVPVANTILYVVDERELAVVLQFGDPVAERTEPGLYAKFPLIQEVRRLPKTYQYWEGSAPDERLVDVTTRDSKKIEATMWAVWRITDPETFVRTLRTLENAETRVKEFGRSNARDVMTRNDLIEIVRSTNRQMKMTLGIPESALAGEDKDSLEVVIEQAMAPEARQTVVLGRKKLMQEIRLDAQNALSDTRKVTEIESLDPDVTPTETSREGGRGIVMVDVGLSQVEFVPEVRNAAFSRLIALMEAIATKNRSEGEQRRQEIINQAMADSESIRGEGAEQSNILRGEVEAEIIAAFAEAIEESGGFYDFNRTLELYKATLKGSDTRLILTTDNALLRLLMNIDAEGATQGDSETPEIPDPPFSPSRPVADANEDAPEDD